LLLLAPSCKFNQHQHSTETIAENTNSISAPVLLLVPLLPQ
jgi:hypothetical protein